MRNLWLVVAAAIAFAPQPQRAARNTVVSIEGREFRVNGRPTYACRSYDGTTVQGLLFNSHRLNCCGETMKIWRPLAMTIVLAMVSAHVAARELPIRSFTVADGLA